MSGGPSNTTQAVSDAAVALVCDRMLTASIGEDWRQRAPERVTAFWMDEVRAALQEVAENLTTARQQAQAVSAEDLRWCEDIADSLREAGGSTNNMRLVALNRLLDHARTAPLPKVRVVESARADYQSAFDTPTNAGEALAWLFKQGEPTCMTFSADKARRAAELLRDALHQPATDSATASMFAELGRAVQKFPTWPTDPLHAVAVLGEEFGELTKAVLQSVYEPHKVEPGEVRQEALQTAAMALRFLRSLDAYVFTPGAQHDQPALAEQPAVVSDDGDDAEPSEPCESGLPDCGPAVAWDCEGIGACERCARELGWIATQHQEPTTPP